MLEKELFAMGGITGENCGLPWKLWPPCKTGRRAKFETGDSHTVTRAGAPSFSMQNDWQLMNIVQQKQHCHQNRNISWQLHYDVIHCNRIKNLVCGTSLLDMFARKSLVLEPNWNHIPFTPCLIERMHSIYIFGNFVRWWLDMLFRKQNKPQWQAGR